MTEKEKNELFEAKLGSEKVYDGVILHIEKDDVLLPNGANSVRECIRHIGAVCVVPVTDDLKVAVERQFRYPVNDVLTEIPAGKLDSFDEDRLEAAKRELREETGIIAEKWTDMGLYYPSPAYTDEKITVYLAQGLSQGERELDEDEFLNVSYVPLKELVADVLAGRITDGKTQVALLKTAALLAPGIFTQG